MNFEVLGWLMVRACGVSPPQLVELLHPFQGRFPTDAGEFNTLETAIRRMGHILENAPHDLASQLRPPSGFQGYAFDGGQPGMDESFAALASAGMHMNQAFPAFPNTQTPGAASAPGRAADPWQQGRDPWQQGSPGHQWQHTPNTAPRTQTAQSTHNSIDGIVTPVRTTHGAAIKIKDSGVEPTRTRSPRTERRLTTALRE